MNNAIGRRDFLKLGAGGAAVLASGSSLALLSGCSSGGAGPADGFLHLRDSDYLLLVNRGWAPWGRSRDQLAPIPDAESTDGVAGIAYFPSEPALQMGELEQSTGWPLLVTHIDIEALQSRYDDRLLPMVLWLAPEQQGSYVRDWNPVWMRPEKSRAYATQWFAFAVVALVFFVILNLRKIE